MRVSGDDWSRLLIRLWPLCWHWSSSSISYRWSMRRYGGNLMAVYARGENIMEGSLWVCRGRPLKGRRIVFKHYQVVNIFDTIIVASAITRRKIVQKLGLKYCFSSIRWHSQFSENYLQAVYYKRVWDQPRGLSVVWMKLLLHDRKRSLSRVKSGMLGKVFYIICARNAES